MRKEIKLSNLLGNQGSSEKTVVHELPLKSSWYAFLRFIAKDPGTYWWHSHAGFQRSNGLFGPIVIRQMQSRDPHSVLYDYDLPEHVLSVTDWLVEMTADRFAAHHHETGDNKPASMLINGEVLEISPGCAFRPKHTKGFKKIAFDRSKQNHYNYVHFRI